MSATYPYCAPANWPYWHCPECGGLYFSNVADGASERSTTPNPLIRCDGCKSIFDTRPPMPNPHANHQGEPGDTVWSDLSPQEIVRRTRCQADDWSAQSAAGWRECCDLILNRLGPVSIASAPTPPGRVGEEVGRELERLSRAITAEIASDRDEAGRLAQSGEYSSANYWNAHASGLEEALNIIRDGAHEEPEEANNDLDWLRKQVVELCEHTEDEMYEALQKGTTNEHEIGFYKGRKWEAKGIRRAICEVIRLRKAEIASAPSPDPAGAGGDLGELADSFVQRVAEWDDRTSPDDWPEAMLITGEELKRELLNFAAEVSRSGKLVASTGSGEETKGACLTAPGSCPSGPTASRSSGFAAAIPSREALRERIARIIFFARNDGVEYDTPMNDALWEHWARQECEVEAWLAADLILAAVALGTEAEGQDAEGSLVHEGPADLSATPEATPQSSPSQTPVDPQMTVETNPPRWRDLKWCQANYPHLKWTISGEPSKPVWWDDEYGWTYPHNCLPPMPSAQCKGGA